MTKPPSERIAVGAIRKAHGIRGEASVEPWTPSLERFAELRAVFLVSPDEKVVRHATIESSREHSGRALVKFAGIDSPEALRELQNWTIEIAESEARELEEDEVFLHDLPGLQLVDTEGNVRGTVLDAYEGGGGVLLNVRGTDGREFELPFAADICTEVDMGAKRIVVNLPAGIDLNAVDPDVDRVLRQAIAEKRIVRFLYGGLERVAEPHDYGIRKGVPTLLAYQIGGRSTSGKLPDWRWVRLPEADALELLDKHFASGRGRSHKKHSEWDELFARVEPAPDAAQG